jgi:hypothetical protein
MPSSSLSQSVAECVQGLQQPSPAIIHSPTNITNRHTHGLVMSVLSLNSKPTHAIIPSPTNITNQETDNLSMNVSEVCTRPSPTTIHATSAIIYPQLICCRKCPGSVLAISCHDTLSQQHFKPAHWYMKCCVCPEYAPYQVRPQYSHPWGLWLEIGLVTWH